MRASLKRPGEVAVEFVLVTHEACAGFMADVLWPSDRETRDEEAFREAFRGALEGNEPLVIEAVVDPAECDFVI